MVLLCFSQHRPDKLIARLRLAVALVNRLAAQSVIRAAASLSVRSGHPW
jgi:hypothetical protein